MVSFVHILWPNFSNSRIEEGVKTDERKFEKKKYENVVPMLYPP